MTAPDRGPQIKGAAVRAAVLWCQQTYSPAEVEAVLATLPAAERARLDPRAEAMGIQPFAWYPMSLVHAFLDAVIATRPEQEQARIAREMSRVAVNKTLRAAYRFALARVTTPERYAANIPWLWSFLHDSGKREVRITAPGRALSRTSEWRGHHPLLCRFTTETMAAVFEAMGCSDVQTRRIACVSEGAPACEYEVTWATPDRA